MDAPGVSAKTAPLIAPEVLVKLRRWYVALIGQETGGFVVLGFMKFWTKSGANSWVNKHQPKEPEPLVKYMVVKR